MFNRRFFERVDINVQCVLYLHTGGVIETGALLRDISESGIGLLMTDDDVAEKNIAEGVDMQFQFEDSFELFDEIVTRVVTSTARVVRVMKTPQGYEVGCILLRADQVEDYIRERKISRYLDNFKITDS